MSQRMSGLKNLARICLALTSGVQFALGSSAVPTNPVTLDSISIQGPACPEGSASITIAPDQRSFSVLFDQATVQSNSQEPLADKYCEVTLVTNVPGGWRTNIYGQQLRGFSRVDPGSRAAQRLIYYKWTTKNRWKFIKATQTLFKKNEGEDFFISKKLKMTQRLPLRKTDHQEVTVVQIQLVAQSNTHKTTSAEVALDSFDGSVEGVR